MGYGCACMRDASGPVPARGAGTPSLTKIDSARLETMHSSNFSSLFELLPIGAYRSSANGRQLRANPALVRLNGYTSEAEMLAAVNDIAREWYVDPSQRDRFRERIQRDGQVVNFRSEIFRHKTRERIWIMENAHVVRNHMGEVLYYEGTVEDITEAHRAQLALEASERRFRALTEKAQVLSMVCDVHGDVLYASPATRTMLGVEPEMLCGSNVFGWIHPDDVADARREMAEVLAFMNSGVESTYRYRHTDGSWRYLASLANNCLADSAVQGIVLNFRDATDLRLHQHRLMAVERERTLLLERERLTRDMHDGLGSLLIGSLVEVERGETDPRRLAAILRDCVDELRSIIHSLEPIDHDLVALLSNLRVRLERRLQAAGLALQWNMDDLPSLAWMGPAEALHIIRIVQEALTNAISHSAAKRICVAAHMVGEEAELVIEDNGGGFDIATVSSGCGIRFLRQRADILGGSLRIESAPEQGTRVVLRLPVVKIIKA